MTEQEEFEFRARLEAEQAAGAPTTAKGALSEINKGLGRGISALPIGIAKGLSMPVEAMGGELSKGIGSEFKGVNVADRAAQFVREKLAPTPANRTEQMLGTGAELTASIAPFMSGPASIPAKVAGLAAPVLGGVAGEGVAESLGLPGEQGKMIGSFAAPVGMALAGRAFSPNISPELRLLTSTGTVPTVGQQTGGFLKRFEKYPVAKELTASAYERANSSFNTSMYNVAVAPIGGKVDKIGFEGYKQARQLAKDAYNEVIPKTTFSWNAALNNERRLHQSTLTKDAREFMEDVFRTKIKPSIDPKTGVIPPDKMKEIDSELGQLWRDANRDPAMEKRAIAKAILEFQGIFRTGITRQNPQHARELNAANAAWNNLIRVGDAVERAGATNGIVSPEQFQQSVRRMDASFKHEAFRSGEAAMQELSSAGVKVLGNRGASVPWGAVRGAAVGGAGLAGIGAGAAAVGGAPLMAPALAAAGTFGSMYTPLGQRLATGMLSGQRAPSVQSLGSIMREAPSYSPATLPLFTDFMRQKQE